MLTLRRVRRLSLARVGLYALGVRELRATCLLLMILFVAACSGDGNAKGHDGPNAPEAGLADGGGSSGDDASVRDAGAGDGSDGTDAAQMDAMVPTTDRHVVINEVDCEGERVELTNIGDDPVDVSRHAVSDDPDKKDHRAQATGTLAPGAFMVVTLGDFGLDCQNESAWLLRGEVVVDEAAPIAVPPGATRGRLPDGTGELLATKPTFGAPNEPFEDPSTALFAPFETPVEIALTIDELAEHQLRVDGSIYVEGQVTLTVGNETLGPLSVGLRNKGRWGTSRSLDQKAGFKIDADRRVAGQRILGLEKLNLNNLVQDPSTVHEWLAYSVLSASGVPTPRTGIAHVTLNGADYGTYLLLEATDDPAFLARHFASTKALYEGEYGEDLFPGAAPYFDQDVGSAADRAALETLITTLHGAPSQAVYTTLDPVLDWDEVLHTMAGEIFIGHWDGYAPTRNNYFLHVDEKGAFSLLPWGVDQTFDDHRALFEGSGLILQRCFEDASCVDAWIAALLSVANAAQTLLDAGLADDARALGVLNAARFATDPRWEWDPSEIQSRVEDAIAFLEQRVSEVRDGVACMQSPSSDVDLDGFACELDCDEGNGDRHHGGIEACGDLVDQNCDGVLDNGPDCPACVPDEATSLVICVKPMTYAEAQAACSAEGARLVDVQSDDEAAAIQARASAWIGEQSYWLGLDDLASEGTFVWNDGSELTYTHWYDGEPNNAGEEDCAHVWGWSDLWNDRPCTASLYAVCEPIGP